MLKLMEDELAVAADLAGKRPGVSPHRVSHALWRLGRRIQDERPELLDEELARMDTERVERRQKRKNGRRP